MRQSPELNGIFNYQYPKVLDSGTDVQVSSLPDR